MKPVRWGVLGNAKFAREHMAPAIHMAEGAELVALATSRPGTVQGWDFHPGLQQVSYEALLADPTIDAVYIPLPNHLHVEWTLKAIAAGKHVLTEKPISMRAEEIDQLIAARDRSGLLVAEAYMIVHHPQWQRARELVQGGAIGKLHETVYSTVGVATTLAHSARMGKVIIDLATHPIDLLTESRGEYAMRGETGARNDPGEQVREDP